MSILMVVDLSGAVRSQESANGARRYFEAQMIHGGEAGGNGA